MIRKSLNNTKNSTYVVLIPHPDPKTKGFPSPSGTGFFISKEGFFITARHVIYGPEGKNNITEDKIKLSKEDPLKFINNVKIIKDWPEYDIILLKAEINKEVNFLEIEFEVVEEGTPVYSFGYPLSNIKLKQDKNIMFGSHILSPRTTSAIISSNFDIIVDGLMSTTSQKNYVIDKALNYGNSGGPIVLNENGKVISICSRFQPVNIQQLDAQIMVPSLYGITTSLKNIEDYLKKNILK